LKHTFWIDFFISSHGVFEKPSPTFKNSLEKKQQVIVKGGDYLGIDGDSC
jgi:hypothetical protein